MMPSDVRVPNAASESLPQQFHQRSELGRARLRIDSHAGCLDGARTHGTDRYHPGRCEVGKKRRAAPVAPGKIEQVAHLARDILGAVGILDQHQCFRHMNNLESVKTYEGTDDMHLLILGEHITGIAAFS